MAKSPTPRPQRATRWLLYTPILLLLLLIFKYYNPHAWNGAKSIWQSRKRTFDYSRYTTTQWELETLDQQVPILSYPDPGEQNPFIQDYLLPIYPAGCNRFPDLKTPLTYLGNDGHASRHYTLPKKDALSIIRWRHSSDLLQKVNWRFVSHTMCPYPPELKRMFGSIWERYVNGSFVDLRWEEGYAPCFLFEQIDEQGNVIQDRISQCGEIKYIITHDWRQFRTADIILFQDIQDLSKAWDYPWIDVSALPPRFPRHRWLLHSTLGPPELPYLTLPSFRSRFDQTIGSPAATNDLFEPRTPLNETIIRKIKEASPVLSGDEISWYTTNEDIGACARMAQWVGKLLKAGLNIVGNGPCAKIIGVRASSARTKMTLVIEDYRCIDRVSSKIYDVLARGSIPLYIGAENIDLFTPQSSVISLHNHFKSPRMAAKQIIRIQESLPMLQKFHAWRQQNDPFCQKCLQQEDGLCRMLQKATLVQPL